jgi:hypothetical protein
MIFVALTAMVVVIALGVLGEGPRVINQGALRRVWGLMVVENEN